MHEETDGNSLWSGEQAAAYESSNYGPGLAGYVLRRSHALIERRFGPGDRFETVLEVGAGSGIHLQYVRHGFARYVMTDASTAMLERAVRRDGSAARDGLVIAAQDACRLAFPDASIDRLIATHVLEHLPQPHLVLQEWLRVLRPGGVLSIVLPCDPGALWRLGRHFGPRRNGRRRGLDYDYLMALEHINPIGNLIAIIRHHAAVRDETWWPMRLPSTDLNLIYAVNVTR